MQTPTAQWQTFSETRQRRFLLCSRDADQAASLASVLAGQGLLLQEADSPDVALRVGQMTVLVVFLDFQPDPAQPGKLAQVSELARALARHVPDLPRIAVGRYDKPEGMLAALRAGVADFVDPHTAPQEVVELLQRLSGAASPPSPTAGRCIALLGVRPGVGTTTLAAHLADIVQLQSRTSERVAQPSSRSLLFDLGWPVGDGLLYLNVGSATFHVAEAVRNLHRLDETLVQTVLPTSANGVAVLSLPANLDDMATVTPADTLTLFARMRQFHPYQVVDLGGFPNADFAAEVLRQADETWIVTDQTVGALVSLADRLAELHAHDVPRARLRLLVNRYDPRYGMTDEQIATRFELPLLGTLPDRTLQLMTSTNQGRLLHESADSDSYVRAVQQLARHMVGAPNESRQGWLERWLPGAGRRGVAAR